MPSDGGDQHVCSVCGATYERRVVGLNGVNSCYCGGTLREVGR